MPHQTLDPAALSAHETYQLMTDLVAPRPIAWVSTRDGAGRRNLAPFSYYQAVCSAPPMVMIACAWRSDGSPKDTLRNILETGEFVVNHVGRAHAEAMNATSADYPAEIDEWAELAHGSVVRLTPVPSVRVGPPRIAEVAAALECRLSHAIPLGVGGAGRPSSTMVVGEVVAFHVDAALLRRDARGRRMPLDPSALDAVGRLGGIAYTATAERFELARPRVPAPPPPPTKPEPPTDPDA